MAVGRTLRSPMRGARSLAEGLRSRANTGAIWGGSGLLWWWFHGGFKYFFVLTQKFGEDAPILTIIFFN